ncbi:MAG: hypothetical protein IID15_08765 [Candidatus Marinimicrobia bacterium]|nr:hypothetical protein [Candidatus Neomarinimicrobiota bacterium]
MGGDKKKRSGPSYEEGRLRDRSIETAQDGSFKPVDLLRLLRKALQPKQVKG